MTFKHKLAARLARLWRGAALVLAVTACEYLDVTVPSTEPVARLEVTPPVLTLYPNQTAQVTAVAYTMAGDTAAPDVTWRVTGGSLLNASTNGRRASARISRGDTGRVVVVAIARGADKLSDTAVASVVPVPVAAVTVTPAAVTTQVGATAQFTAVARDSAGGALTGRTVTWSTNATAVATVNSTGLATAVATGAATITATSEGKSGAAAMTVVVPAPVAAVTVSPASASVAVGGTVQLTATPRDAAGHAITGRTITWTSNNTAAATVNSTGRVTAVAAGSATITATADGQSGTAAITVVAPPPVATVTVRPDVASVVVDGNYQFTALLKDAAGQVVSGSAVTWTSGNPAVATVGTTGMARGVTTGTTTITASSGGISGSAVLNVIPPPPIGVCGAWPAGITAWIQPLPLSTGQAFYASPTGSDANPGTLAAPWKSLTKVNSLQPGQVLYLRAGTYGARGTTALDFNAVGTAAAPITLAGYPGDSRPILQGRLYMTGAYIRMSGVVIDGPTGNVGGPGPGGEAITITLKGQHLELSNSEVRFDQWHAGVGVDGAYDYRVLNNYIHDNGGYLGDYSTADAQWNTSHGMYNSPSSYGLIANNVIEHNDAKGLMGRHNANHIVVVNNTVVGNGRYGIDVAESTYDWILANNILLNNGTIKGGGGIGTPGSGGASYVQINNIFWKNGTNGTTTWDNNGTIINNIVADPMLVNPAVATNHQNPNPTTDNQLRLGSPAIGAANANYTLPFDITGKCRGTSPDAGAYQR